MSSYYKGESPKLPFFTRSAFTRQVGQVCLQRSTRRSAADTLNRTCQCCKWWMFEWNHKAQRMTEEPVAQAVSMSRLWLGWFHNHAPPLQQARSWLCLKCQLHTAVSSFPVNPEGRCLLECSGVCRRSNSSRYQALHNSAPWICRPFLNT